MLFDHHFSVQNLQLKFDIIFRFPSFLLLQEDITKVIAAIEKEEAKRAAASEKTLKAAPSPRAYASLTPHPTNNELILFGGEYHNGQKVC